MIFYNALKSGNQMSFVENQYDESYFQKTETIFSQCNGYMGVRACFETDTLHQTRGMFVSGLYNKAYIGEVTELINCPDIIGMKITINEKSFHLDTCTILDYQRKLNVTNGELSIRVLCELKDKTRFYFHSNRFVSLDEKNLFCHKVTIEPLEVSMNVTIETGINGQITNSGVSHFQQVESRVYDKKYMHLVGRTNEDYVSVLTHCKSSLPCISKVDFVLKRRSIAGKYKFLIQPKETLSFEKISYITTSFDQTSIDAQALSNNLNIACEKGFDRLLEVHNEKFAAYFNKARITIDGVSVEEEAAILFAQYHLLGMTPFYTDQFSVGAKGLTGEGYKGHVFWDTEIFVMPFFVYLFPDIAKNLATFRHRGLAGARQKANAYGYQGAMFPWESARDGSEETPLYAALNIHTGKAAKVWSGIKEHHVTADIVYAIWEYYTWTKDQEFMDKFGYEVIFEGAKFWQSRAILKNGRYEILDIIGPDEYTEHVDNNAYTNYMVYHCVQLALTLFNSIKEKNKEVFHRLNKSLGLESASILWVEFLSKLYLPKVNENQIVPQDDTFLQKSTLPNIEKYRNSKQKQSVLLDYSRNEVIDKQVLKQADVVMLMNLLPNLFDKDVVKKNVLFYEERTIHDSSLSLCAHAIACAHIKEKDMAYDFFMKALEIDLDENPNDTTDGIHAASLGGILNCLIKGFAGVSHTADYIEFSPCLPDKWKKMTFTLSILQTDVKVIITSDLLSLTAVTPLSSTVEIKVGETIYKLDDEITIRLIKEEE